MSKPLSDDLSPEKIAETVPPVPTSEPVQHQPVDAGASADAEYDEDEYEEFEEEHSLFHRIIHLDLPSWLISTMVHLVAILALALMYIPSQPKDEINDLVASPIDKKTIEELINPEAIQFDEKMVLDAQVAEFEPMDVETQDLDFSAFDEPEALTSVPLVDISADTAPSTDLIIPFGSFNGDELSGRGSGKGTLVATGGGSEGSEAAVRRALDWLAAHQMPDGGWSFDFRSNPNCKGQCSNPGQNNQARNAATGLALLPFLGAGQTHKEGRYTKVVEGGLYYLKRHMKISPTQGGSWHEAQGRMYSHGIASIAMCEAYAMTRDQSLLAPAQQSINYICYAQDPVGGGWRYEARTPGDTSVVGWQLMALKSANMSNITIPRLTLERSNKYLDYISSTSDGAYYGYDQPLGKVDRATATTAIGLLCRMYMGWKRENPALQKGVAWLDEMGPHNSDVYYNYYATQVMKHWGGAEWDRWNKKMRDRLIETQATQGHERGSWYYPDNHSEKGGRLYVTSMNTMILEVYYRYLPIYQKKSSEESFPID